METFIPNSIKDIILYYLNPHELYLEELKDKIKNIGGIFTNFTQDCAYTKYLIINNGCSWEINRLYCEESGEKCCIIYHLNERMNNRNVLFDIIRIAMDGMHYRYQYGYKGHERTNRCYMGY